MTVVKIPVQNDPPFYSFKIELSGTVYILAFKYNKRMDRWILDLKDGLGNDLSTGMIIQNNVDLKANFTGIELPEGRIFPFDTKFEDNEMIKAEFGNRYRLAYVTE